MEYAANVYIHTRIHNSQYWENSKVDSYIDGYYNEIDNASYIDFCNALESILHLVFSIVQPIWSNTDETNVIIMYVSTQWAALHK